MSHPVDAWLLMQVEAQVEARFGMERVRLRSSSNTEDLPGFNGAGLYTSVSAEIGNPDRTVENALRTVWASLWSLRAYDERSYHGIDQEGVAMGVLVHPAYLDERANGVGISRNVLEPIRTQYYLNIQYGEASVTNPAPGITTDQILFSFYRTPEIRYVGFSNLDAAHLAPNEDEIRLLACQLRGIHNHFRPLLDPTHEIRWFAMDIEFKFLGPARTLMIKQARPYSFGNADIPADCREL